LPEGRSPSLQEARCASLRADERRPASGLAPASVDDRLVVSHCDDTVASLGDVDDSVVWTADSPAYPFGSVVV